MQNYKQLKQAGKVSTLKIDDVEITLEKKQYSQETGEEVSAQKDTYIKSTLLQNKLELEKSLADINELLKEFDKQAVVVNGKI